MYYPGVRIVLPVLLLAACVPASLPEPDPWPDLEDLLAGRASEEELGYRLPWDQTLSMPPTELSPYREVVHGCLMLPMSGDLAEQGRVGLQGAVLAYEERRAERPGGRQILWHVVDTQSKEKLAGEGVTACLRRGALLVVTPPRASDFDFLAGGLMDQGAGVFVPVAGLTDVSRIDTRFVFVRPPLAAPVGELLGRAATARRGEGKGAALVVEGGSSEEVGGAWSAVLEAGGWTSLGTRTLPGPEPEPWRAAFQEVVAAGATDVLVIGSHTGGRPLVEELSQEAMADVHLWFLAGRVHDALLVEAEFRGALDRVHFLAGLPPSEDFVGRYEARWREEPSGPAATVYDAVRRGYDAGEEAEFLEPVDLAATARASTGRSAWGQNQRRGEGGLDYVAGADYQAAYLRRKTVPSWIWELVRESPGVAHAKRRRPLGPSKTVDPGSGFSVFSRSIGSKPGGDSLVGAPNAFCEPSDGGPPKPAGNRSPEVEWTRPPVGTRSLALVAVDPDRPQERQSINVEGVAIPEDAPREDFFHWAVVDIDPDLVKIPAGASAPGDGVVAPKAPGRRDFGVEGVNDYTTLFQGDAERAGVYGGWDGPCPPWNDERIHRLSFILYALDVPTLGLRGAFTGADVEEAIAGHVLSEVSFTGVYFINPALVLPPVPDRTGY